MSWSSESPTEPDQPRSRLRLVAQWLVVLIIFWFIGRSLVANWDEMAEADLHFNVGILLLSLALLGLWMLGQALIWHLLTISTGAAIPLPKALAAWFYSQLGKYIPGKVFLYMGRLAFYVRENRRVGPVTLAFGLETVCTFAAAIFTVLLAILTVDSDELDRYRWVMVGALAAFAILLHPRILSGLISFSARLLRRQPFPVTLSYPMVLRYLGLYIVNWVFFGAALFLMIRSFYPVEASSILYLAGAFSFSSMVGIVALFAPSGLGVREGLLGIFLNQIMPLPVALLVAVVTRVWLTVMELAMAGLVFALIRTGVIEADGIGPLRSGEASDSSDGGVKGDTESLG